MNDPIKTQSPEATTNNPKKNMYWHFPRLWPDQVETEITQRDQFNNDAVSISETIVREAIQNSLDAAISDPARVRVSFRWVDKSNGIDPAFFEVLFNGQLEHAEAARIDLASIDFDNPKALIIEDYGTKGLTGSIDEKDNDNFSDFWRRHGKSHKTGKSRGRWGLGKLVYSQTSQIGAFFGVTRRAKEQSPHLMGQTVLNLRKVDGQDYQPHAFFADLKNKGEVSAQLPIPVEDEDFVEEFIENFSVNRDEPGLSVVIPFPNEEFSREKMIEVSIGNYFYPLITGQLVLSFNDLEINSTNVRDLAKQYAGSRFHQIDLLFDFIEKVYLAEQSDHLQMKPSWMDDKKLDADDFDLPTLEKIRQQFSNGELVSLYLPVTLKPRNGPDIESGFTVNIQKPSDLKKGFDIYVRGGLTLPEEAKIKERCALGAMIAEEEAICDFLGDAENAAHTNFSTNTEKLRRKYRNNQHTSHLVSAIRKSVVQLYDLLAEVTDEEDEDALQDFFWFDEPEKERRKRRKKPKPPKPVPDLPKKPTLIQLSQVDGGFTLTGTEALTDEQLPRQVEIRMAYDVPKGNPFRNYDKSVVKDFKLGRNSGIVCKAKKENVKTISVQENKIIVEVHSLPFRLSVTGFDKNRDLLVDWKQAQS